MAKEQKSQKFEADPGYFQSVSVKSVYNSADDFTNEVYADYYNFLFKFNMNSLGAVKVVNTTKMPLLRKYESKVHELWERTDFPMFLDNWVKMMLDWYGYQLWNDAFNSLRKVYNKAETASDKATSLTDEFLSKYRYLNSQPKNELSENWLDLKVDDKNKKLKVYTVEELMNDFSRQFPYSLDVSQYPTFKEKKHYEKFRSWCENKCRKQVLLNDKTFSFKRETDFDEFKVYVERTV